MIEGWGRGRCHHTAVGEKAVGENIEGIGGRHTIPKDMLLLAMKGPGGACTDISSWGRRGAVGKVSFCCS